MVLLFSSRASECSFMLTSWGFRGNKHGKTEGGREKNERGGGGRGDKAMGSEEGGKAHIRESQKGWIRG